MIHSFTFKNFCSFSEKATISFIDIRKGVETKSNMFCDSPSSTRLSKVTTVIGHNASGKTSALKALSFLGWFVRNSFVGLEGDQEIPVDTFAFSGVKDDISEFELIFEHEGNVYKYILHLCRDHVVNEELYQKEKTQHFNYLFKRTWNSETKKSDITTQRIELKTEVVREILRKNVSLIAASVAIKNDILTKISNFWSTIFTNVNRSGKQWNTTALGDKGLLRASKSYDNDKELFVKAISFLKNADIGLAGIFIEHGEMKNTKTGEKRDYWFPYGEHEVDGKKHKLEFFYESSGTKNLFVLLHYLLPVVQLGGLAIIDELEVDLHPHLLPLIIELFANPQTNPKNSQLLFASHSVEILNYLEKEQVILVEKNENCKSELYRLDELKGVRRDDNIYAKYMAGAYGAVPNI